MLPLYSVTGAGETTWGPGSRPKPFEERPAAKRAERRPRGANGVRLRDCLVDMFFLMERAGWGGGCSVNEMAPSFGLFCNLPFAPLEYYDRVLRALLDGQVRGEHGK